MVEAIKDEINSEFHKPIIIIGDFTAEPDELEGDWADGPEPSPPPAAAAAAADTAAGGSGSTIGGSAMSAAAAGCLSTAMACASIKSSRHPYAAFFHVFFKVAALLVAIHRLLVLSGRPLSLSSLLVPSLSAGTQCFLLLAEVLVNEAR